MSERRRPLPALGVVVPRPMGVFWARTGLAVRDPFCEVQEHPVYAVDTRREKKGQPGVLETVRAWACAWCWPPEEDEP